MVCMYFAFQNISPRLISIQAEKTLDYKFDLDHEREYMYIYVIYGDYFTTLFTCFQ